MMKQNRSTFIEWQCLILALVGILYGLLEPAYCQDLTDTTVLLLQQTDPHGGTITPDVGVHHLDLDAEVLLTAVPKPGYYFVYWIGDVSDPTANSTIVYLNEPKIVVAVFVRSEFAFLLDETVMLGGGGNGGLRSSGPDYGNQGYTGGGAKRPQKFKWPQPSELVQPGQPSPEELPSEFPIPGEEPPDEFPIPEAPEPATVLLLGLGSLLLVRRSPMDSLRRTKR